MFLLVILAGCSDRLFRRPAAGGRICETPRIAVNRGEIQGYEDGFYGQARYG